MTGRPDTYTTKQGDAILAYFVKHKNEHLVAAQIADEFASDDISIGRTTVYRQLDKLVREGKVRKYITGENTAACFQYVDRQECAGTHLHLKCETCGVLIHTKECSLSELEHNFRDAYGFEVDVGRTMFYGSCRSCLDKLEV